MRTGVLYTNLFSDYTIEQFEQSVSLQIDRFKRWNLPIKDAVCLDVGCGGGRTLIALKRMGASDVYGIDIDGNLVNLAKERSECNVQIASALALPFEDKTFDVVICSGVLHHTTSIRKGLSEIHRVLKKDGVCYLLLYKWHPRWIGTLMMRAIAKFIPFNIMRLFLFFLSPSKRYNMMDNWYVEHLHILTESEILKMVDDNFYYKEADKGKPMHNIRLLLNRKKEN